MTSAPPASRPRWTLAPAWAAATAIAAAFVLTGCMPQVKVDEDEREAPPRVEFDPARKLVPTPNNLALVDGRMSLPDTCIETPVLRDLREKGLNRLDGASTYMPAFQVTFTHPIDPESLDDRVFFFCRKPRSTALLACAPNAAACEARVDEETRYDLHDCHGTRKTHVLTVTPTDPLGEGTTCGVVLLEGIRTTDGVPFASSPAWHLVRPRERPVALSGDTWLNATPIESSDIETLRDLEDLWEDHQPLLKFLETEHGIDPLTTLIAWEATTQTILAPLDPSVPGSPAAFGATVTDAVSDLVFWRGPDEVALEYVTDWTGPDYVHPCDVAPCEAVGTVLEGSYVSPRFLQYAPNPGPFAEPITDQWTDPVAPEVVDPDAKVKFLAWFPDPAVVPQPATGYPMVIIGHGFTRMKEIWYTAAAELAARGLAGVAIDAINHGARAIRTQDAAAMNCDGPRVYDGDANCFEPIIGLDLATARDNIRQTVLDTLKLARVIAADSFREGCLAAGHGFCDELAVDPERIGYSGGSMGCMIGTIVTAMSPHIRASVLNAGGADWVEVFRDTLDPDIKCPTVDALIGLGILEGNLYNNGRGTDPLCLQEGWQDEPRLLSFINVARWLLDPAIPANYADRIRQRAGQVKVMFQIIRDEPFIPNSSTLKLGRLLGLGPPQRSGTASDVVDVVPSPAICQAVTNNGSVFVEYLPEDGDPVNAFEHRSMALGPVWDPDEGAISTKPQDLRYSLARKQLQGDVAAFLAETLARVGTDPPSSAGLCP